MSMLFDNCLDSFHKLFLMFTSNTKSVDYKIQDIINDINKKHYFQVVNVSKLLLDLDHYPLYHIAINNGYLKNMEDQLVGSLSVLKVKDICEQYNDIRDINQYLNYYFKKQLENPYLDLYKQFTNTLLNMNHEIFLKFLVTEGMASHLLKYNKDNDTYYIDLLYMYKYNVRKGLLPYGAFIEFDNDLKVKFIKLPFNPHVTDYEVKQITHNCETIFTPQNNKWLLAYNIFISTLICYITVVEHATKCHFILAGTINYWNHTNKNLNVNIINLLKPFLYMTSHINSAAVMILINQGGFVHRLFSFTYESFKKLMADTITNYSYANISKIKKDNGITIDTPFYHDAINMWNIIENFVSEYVNAINIENDVELSLDEIISVIPSMVDKNKTAKENIITVLTAHIFNVSFWHEHIGNMTMYVLNPQILKTKVYYTYPFSLFDTKQNTIQNINLALLTSNITMPKITDDIWRTQIYNNFQYREIFDNFQKNLSETKFLCKHLVPELLECSVSL